jgi:hypothetical protein
MRVLLYTPELSGHHQVYGRVIGRVLLDAGHEVILASPSARSDWLSRWTALKPFADESAFQGLDLRERSVCTVEALVEIQKQYRVDATLFTHADGFAGQFRRIAAGSAPRLRGRVCAVFSGACEWHPGEDIYTGRRKPLFGPTVRQTLGRAGRALFHRTETARYFYETVLLRSRAVDAVIVKDERIAAHFGPPVFWMPEIYRVFDLLPEERRGPDYERFAGPVGEYMARAGGGANVLLYFGTGAWYKGYDRFLQLAQQDAGAFALHAGAPDRREPGKEYDGDVAAVRQDLLRQGRLFETHAFVESQDLVDLLFGGIGRFVSTHRLTLSSGTALQALEAGRPLLTPDTGLIGWRTRTFGLGAAYAYGDPSSLRDRWVACRTGDRFSDVESLPAFMRRFSGDAVRSFFLEQLCI